MQTVQEATASHSNCRTHRTGEFFQKLSPEALADLTPKRSSLGRIPVGEVLFNEKQNSTGVFLIREGMVRLSMNSSDGKRLSLRVARAGEILGLTSALSGNEM